MSWPLIIAIVASLTVVDVVILGMVIRLGWRWLPREFPATPPRVDAVWRRRQSFRIGVLNFGFCIQVAVDEQHLHMVPIKPLRAFGAAPASIPWHSIRIEKHTPGGRWVTVRIGTHTMKGPAWCLELATPAEAAE